MWAKDDEFLHKYHSEHTPTWTNQFKNLLFKVLDDISLHFNHFLWHFSWSQPFFLSSASEQIIWMLISQFFFGMQVFPEKKWTYKFGPYDIDIV